MPTNHIKALLKRNVMKFSQFSHTTHTVLKYNNNCTRINLIL